MARYRVQGPDGKIHVFDGPDGASPADVEAFAAQTFGGKPEKPAAPALPPMQTQPDTPGILQTLAIGAGKTVDVVMDGLTQMYLGARGEAAAGAGLKQQVDEKAALYKPLQEARPMATAIGEALPAMVVPVGGSATLAGNLGRMAVAGALPGALEYGSAGERAGRAAGGAAGAVAGGILAPKIASAVATAVPAVGRTLRAVTEPLTAGGRQNIAGRTLNRAAGADAGPAAARMRSAAPMVPGSIPTAAQVAENGGIAALERQVAAANPANFTTRGMEQAAARLQSLRGLAGDDAAMAGAQAARKATTKPLYAQAAGREVLADPALQDLLARPSVKAALERAAKIAAEDGRAFGYNPGRAAQPGPQFVDEAGNALFDLGTKAQPAKITGQTLQDIKMGMDALLKDPTSGIAGREADLVRQTRGQLMNWMENAIPDLRQARTTYADMSRPINQMQVGQDLLKRIEPALADFGALGKESANKYALALRNTEQTARNATGFKGVNSLADVLDQPQLQLVTSIAQDLARKANAQELGRGGGSDTFQKLAMSNIAERSGAPGVVGAAMNFPGVSKLAKFMYSGPDEEIKTLIAQALLKPEQAATLMGRSGAAVQPPINGRQLLFSSPSRAAQVLGGTGGLATTNLLAQ